MKPKKKAKIERFKVGDKVQTFLIRSTGEKKKVRGTIKKIRKYYGRKTYIISGGVAEDFPTRTVKKI